MDPGDKHRDDSALQLERHTMSGLVASYGLIAPEIVLVVGAMALLMLGVFRPENDREAETIGWLAILVLGLAAWLVLEQPVGRQSLFDGGFVIDGFGRFMKVLTLVASAGALLLSFDYMRETKSQKFEYPVLVLLFGFYPAPLLDVTAVSVKKLVTNYETAIRAASAMSGR